MRLFWPIPTVICIVSGIAYAMCMAAGWRNLVHELLAASSVSIIGGELCAVPLWLARGRGEATVSQAGLAVSILHLVLVLMLAGLAIVTKLAGAPIPFLLWLLPLYWVSLGVLVALILGAIRQESARDDKSAGAARP